MPPTRRELTGGTVAGFVAGLVLGVVLHLGVGADQLRLQASIYLSDPGTGTAWVVHLVHSTLIGGLYAVVASYVTNWYVNRLLSLTRRSQRLTDLIMPLIRRFGIGTVVAAGMGLTFGTLVWVGFDGAVVPLLADGAGNSVPDLRAISLVGYIAYGFVLGTGYGLLLSRV